MRVQKNIFLWGLFVAAGMAAGADQTPNSTPAKPPKFKFTLTERIRQETSDNVSSLNEASADSSSYVRFRTSFMGQWLPSKSFELTVRLTNENRYYLAPKTDVRAGKNHDLHEVFFDYLNIRWKNPAGLPLILTVGRQDLMLGEGFVIWDGGPLDGSRSAYFNAVRADWAVGAKTTLSLFYVDQPRTDTLLPRIHDAGQKMVEQSEQGFGLYLTGAVQKIGLESYVFRKNTRPFEAAPASGLTVLGARFIFPFSARFSLTSEGAYQSGFLGERDRSGLGGYFHFDFKTGAVLPLPAQITLGGLYLSGDDPRTAAAMEGWDPAFSRWPKWSESLIYLLGKETGKPAYWSNFISLNGTLQFALADNIRLQLAAHHLRAAHKTGPSAFWSGAGKTRGRLIAIKMLYDVSKNLAGHLIWDHFTPGDFYIAGARSYAWVRFELLFKY